MTIKSLLRWCCPSNIARFVSLVVIDAIKSVSARLRANVCDKCCEIIQPFRAHTNTPAAVSGVVVSGRLIAPPFGIVPSPIFRKNLPSRAIAVTKIWFLRLLQASAALRMPIFEALNFLFGYSPAIARTYPQPISSVILHDQSTESLTDEMPASHARHFINNPRNLVWA